MAGTDLEFAALIEHVLMGNKEAAQQLHEEYGPHILRAVRRRLHHRLRSKFDSLDFVQDVWASFFRTLPDHFQFDNPDDLVAFLTTVARNKVAEVSRARLERQKQNVNREQVSDDVRQSMDRFPGPQPTPSEILMSREAWEQVLAKLPLVHRRILILFREGRTVDRIAANLGLSVRQVQRVLRRAMGEETP